MDMNKNKFRALALIEVIGNLRNQVWPITLVLTLKAHWSVHLASTKNRLTWHFFEALDLCRPVSANQQKARICKRSRRKGLISQPQAFIHGEWTFVEFTKKACFQFEPWPGSGLLYLEGDHEMPANRISMWSITPIGDPGYTAKSLGQHFQRVAKFWTYKRILGIELDYENEIRCIGWKKGCHAEICHQSDLIAFLRSPFHW